MELETRRLILRPLNNEDAPAMAQALNNINVSRNLARVKFPYTLQDAEAFIARQFAFDQRSVVRAIAFKCAPEELIGMVSYETTQEGKLVFGYWLRECCWHMRIMSEAAAALVHHAFAEGGVEALESAYHADNPNSGRILRRLGFIETHSEMNFSLARNQTVPTMKLSLAREDWHSQQKSRAA